MTGIARADPHEHSMVLFWSSQGFVTQLMKTLLAVLVLFAATCPEIAFSKGVLTCKLEEQGDRWIGPCGRFSGERLALGISESESVSSGPWRSDLEPTEVWSGEMWFGNHPPQVIEIERYDKGLAFARTVFGWFQLSGWKRSNERIEFDMNTGKVVAPSKLDYLIIRRAGEILESEEAWNRADNRKCPQVATRWSIYCAMKRASIDMTGAFHHRRPALQTVRRIVQMRSENRDYQHRLMDYNNDESTKFEDVHSLLTDAQEMIRQDLE